MIDTARIDKWLGLYQEAWRTDDPAEIARLFTDDARYYTEPFREAHRGKDDIVSWWIGNGDSKVPWTFDHEVIAQEGDLYVVRGVTRYPKGGTVDRSAPEVYHNLWLVTLATDGRASEFVEYWMEEPQMPRRLALDGSSWRLLGWSVSSLYPPDFEITAQFAGGKMAGKAAVNRYTGSYTADFSGADGMGGFSVGPVASTKMAGPEPAMRAEDAYFRLLEQARLYRLDDSGLRLLDADGNELLIYGPTTSE